MDLQSLRTGAPAVGQPRRQPGTDLGRQVAKQVPSRPMHPYLGCFLIRRIGDQVERIARFDRPQMPVPIGESDAMDGSTEVRWPAIRERRTISHAGWDVWITVHQPRVIR